MEGCCQKIQCAILEAEAWGVAESIRWSEILEIDTSVRAVGLFESLHPADLRLEQGQYVFVGEPNHQMVWSVFGESKVIDGSTTLAGRLFRFNFIE